MIKFLRKETFSFIQVLIHVDIILNSTQTEFIISLYYFSLFFLESTIYKIN